MTTLLTAANLLKTAGTPGHQEAREADGQNHENMAKMIEHRDAMTPEQGDSENYHFRI